MLGGGVAGLSFALKAAERGSVAVLTKRERVESNTHYAQGGISAVLSRRNAVAVMPYAYVGGWLRERQLSAAVPAPES